MAARHVASRRSEHALIDGRRIGRHEAIPRQHELFARLERYDCYARVTRQEDPVAWQTLRVACAATQGDRQWLRDTSRSWNDCKPGPFGDNQDATIGQPL